MYRRSEKHHASGSLSSDAESETMWSDAEDDADSNDDESIPELPGIVKLEMERREDAKARGLPPCPPSAEAIHALRKHFISGGAKPAMDGGFITCMEDLGAVPKSDDDLVKDTQYNVWYLGFDEDTEEWWNEREQMHRSEVRLLRYKEFVDSQEAKGLGPDPNWYSSLEREDDEDDESSSSETEIESSNKEDYDLNKKQILAFGETFTKGLWRYTSSENIYHGLASGVKVQQSGAPAAPGGLKVINIDVSEDTLHHQCAELRNRYDLQKRPLGPKSFLGREDSKAPQQQKQPQKKRGKQKSKGRRANPTFGTDGRDHDSSIQIHVSALLTTLEEQLLPSAATARMLSSMSDLLSSAAMADRAVARSLIDKTDFGAGSKVIHLRANALKYAKDADKDLSRPSWAANAWWQAFTVLTDLMACAIRSLGSPPSELTISAESSTEDSHLAAKYFTHTAAPALLKSVSSSLAAERAPSLCALGDCVSHVSSDCVLALVKDKSTWELVEAACLADGPPDDGMGKREKHREERMIPYAAADSAALVTKMCAAAMEIDNSIQAMTPVAPNSVATKMIKRGVVPLLMQLTRSSLSRVSTEAINALAQISRVKDCRAVMLQEDGAADLLAVVLNSPDASRVSPAMLLISHLLWDEEWRDPIMAIQPPVQNTAVRWAAFAMQRIRKCAQEIREERDIWKEEMAEKMIRQFRVMAQDPYEGNRIKQQLEEDKAKEKNELHWLEVETEKNQNKMFRFVLSRSLLLLSSTLHHKDAPNRVLNAGGIPLAAACIDCPLEDTHMASAILISNLDASSGPLGIRADRFPDPLHVVQAVFSRLDTFAEMQVQNANTMNFVVLANRLMEAPGWSPYFEALGSRDPKAKFWIEECLPRIRVRSNSAAAGAAKEEEKCRSTSRYHGGVHSKCSQLTGKLQACAECGKMEGRKGEFNFCSRCMVAKYCGRHCQRKAWKKHKKECKLLAAAKSV